MGTDTRTSRQLLNSLVLGLSLMSTAACQEQDPLLDEQNGATLLDEQDGANPFPMPPISGGTLLVTRDDAIVVAAEAERDSVWLIDSATRKPRGRFKLAWGSEPGRLVEDRNGWVHIVLRGPGEVLQINPRHGALGTRQKVCPAPRGIAYDSVTDKLHIACAGGELVTLNASSGEVERTLFIDSDLRDVVVEGDHLLISRFRSAELITVQANGVLTGRARPRQRLSDEARDAMGNPISSSATAAWRMAALPGGGAMMLHQRASDGSISISPNFPGSYGPRSGPSPGPCTGTGIVSTAVTVFNVDGSGGSNTLTVGSGLVTTPIPVAFDLAVSRNGHELALVGPELFVQAATADLGPADPCNPNPSSRRAADGSRLVAAAYDSKGNLWIQSQTPAGFYLSVPGQPLFYRSLASTEERFDEGHSLFHTVTGAMMACVSCHMEAGDDGHTWNFTDAGPRRTQSLRGGLHATAPFHWDGDMKDIGVLMTEVFTRRMSGISLRQDQKEDVGKWLDAQPMLPRSVPADRAAVERGKALFSDPSVGCLSCHGGAHFTNNQNFDVGTGKEFQVPSLIGVGMRAPYLHNGCAATLRGRFEPTCGGGDKHGRTSHLSELQLDDLVAYLQTL